jgi:ABC-type Fe3+/spermidine/putrescine transport system ATPase subunit
MLDLVGLARFADRYPRELSGGQQQRVALARALAPRPELLLLDEPFSNLDTGLRERLALELREIIKASGATAVLVTHDQHEAFAMADEIGVMRDGRIEQWDSAYNLYHRPVNRFVADFVGQGVFLPARALNGSQLEIELGVLERTRRTAQASWSGLSGPLRQMTWCTTTTRQRRPKWCQGVSRCRDLYTLRLASRRSRSCPATTTTRWRAHRHPPDVDHVVAFTPA